MGGGGGGSTSSSPVLSRPAPLSRIGAATFCCAKERLTLKALEILGLCHACAAFFRALVEHIPNFLFFTSYEILLMWIWQRLLFFFWNLLSHLRAIWSRKMLFPFGFRLQGFLGTRLGQGVRSNFQDRHKTLLVSAKCTLDVSPARQLCSVRARTRTLVLCAHTEPRLNSSRHKQQRQEEGRSHAAVFPHTFSFFFTRDPRSTFH